MDKKRIWKRMKETKNVLFFCLGWSHNINDTEEKIIQKYILGEEIKND